ncbi:ABC transporter permease subunit [Streptomyces sp. NPDC087903]|uniref:ABC transporter permease subunit n=1 Tax=Streptomyces sp. NPDC087903 TaxID=3365819 RepID=UPI00380CCFE8
MTTTPTPSRTPYRSALHPTRAGFPGLLRAEWTKFRTVRAWPLVLAVAAAVTVVISQLGAAGSSFGGGPEVTVGPDGTVVTDAFHFTHRPLTGDGSLTARVTGLRSADGRDIEPWAKAGLMVKRSLDPGAPYAAVMTTPEHGVRMQWNFTHDTAGDGGGTAAWLRLTRSGDRLTGYESGDGRTWHRITEVRLDGLPRTVQVGLFVATPAHQVLRRSFGGTTEVFGGGSVTAAFDGPALRGTSTGAGWTSTDVGGPVPNGPTPADAEPGRTRVSATGTHTLTGRGDVAPDESLGDPVQMSFQGVFVGVLFMVALGALFVTSEYKRGLIRTTFTATPSRTRVLAAKTLVVTAVTFAVSLPATALSFTLAQSRLRTNGYRPPAFPDLSLLDTPALRAVVGSAALLSLVAVLALAVGVLLRTSAGAIAAVVVLVVLPQILAFALPLPAAHWLLRLTPAAAFAIQQGVTYYPQVEHNCLPESGCYPMTPWGGLSVLAAYAGLALLLAAWRLRGRDA